MKIIGYIANRMPIILGIYVASVICSALLFSYFENKSFWDGIWWSVVTALTIGYGDLTPATVAGRVSAIIFSHFWIFGIIPMLIANIVTRALEDKDRFTNEEQEWQEKMLIGIARKVGAKVHESPPKY